MVKNFLINDFGKFNKCCVQDYINCANYLIDKKIAKPNNLIAYGQSAGSTIVSKAINLDPTLFHAAIFDYPFLDMVNSMFDPTLPLTTVEYSEWGDPAIEKERQHLIQFSPYHNTDYSKHPHLLFLTGENDYQTPAWMALKTVASYRQNCKSDNEILIRIAKGGHPGSIAYPARMDDLIYQLIFTKSVLNRISESSAD